MSGRRWALGLLAAGMALRLGYMVHVHSAPALPVRVTDPEAYDTMAGHLLDYHELSVVKGAPLTEREPLYPLILALGHLLMGRSYLTGLVLNLLFAGFACWAVYLLAAELFEDEATSLLALAFACFYPEWVYYTAYLLRETLVSLLLATWALLWARRAKLAPARAFALMGLAFGMLSLVRSAYIPAGAAFMLLAAWRVPARQWARTVGAFALAATLVQVPWIARNYRVTGRFVAGASLGGSVMYLSLLADYSRPERALEYPLDHPDDVIKQAQGLPIAQAEPLYYRACRDIFVHRPGLFWSAFLHKAAKLWRPYPNEGWSYGHSLRWLKLVGLLSNGPLLVLGLAGAWLFRRRPGVDLLLLTPAVMTFIYGLFWAVTRYHAPLMLCFMPLAAAAVARARRR